MAKRSVSKGIIKDIVIVGVGVLIIWIGLQAVFGTQNPFYVVASGSMIPVLEVYDVLIVSGHEPFDGIVVGDIIVFNRPSDHDRVIVHRVVSIIEEDPKAIRTKGDANPSSIPGTDFPITEDEYIGKVAHIIPQIGYVTQILKPPINYIIIAIVIGIMIAKQFVKKKKDLREEPLSGELKPMSEETTEELEGIDKIKKDSEYSEHVEKIKGLEGTNESEDMAKTDEINKKLEYIDESIEKDKESRKEE